MKQFLYDRFGQKGFAYMGDATADLPVEELAVKAITVNAPTALRREAERLCYTNYKRRYAYVLTPKGIARKMKDYEALRREIDAPSVEMLRRDK